MSLFDHLRRLRRDAVPDLRSRRRAERRRPEPSASAAPARRPIPSLEEARRMSPATSHRVALPVEIEGFHHVVVSIPEGGEEAARDFWQTIMGLREIPKPRHLAGHGVWLRGEQIEVHCPPIDPFTPQVADPPAFLVPDVEYAVRQLVANGVPAVLAQKVWPGWVRATLSDPFGNRIRLVSPEPDEAA